MKRSKQAARKNAKAHARKVGGAQKPAQRGLPKSVTVTTRTVTTRFR